MIKIIKSLHLERVHKVMINLKDMNFYESEFTKIVTQGEIG